ncbi:putative exported protease [Serinicoccus hydrothermalis]|uniref:Putative exported protease n=1 Tax=Serinicoccus hydrothermalis TaxID=1758689 RepID=A0A1B1NBS3_9MICO|nr:alpha/beta hydrolase [Serinicoccus hydrothermalis]ANS78872.1 putative exported protease [Serinicoccus hydrothermalis]
MGSLVRTSTTVRMVAGLSAFSLLAACTPGQQEEQEQEGQTSSADAAPEAGAASTPLAQGAPEGLEEFYSQELTWSSCEGDFECASLTVPVDYEEPDGQTIDLALLRSAASGDTLGSLVVNPGGPGGSGVDYAKLSGMAVSSEVLEAYDVVGFDPRGVARSAPITCFEDEQMDEFLSSDPSPDDATEEEASEQLVEDFAQACEERAPDLLGHVSTVEAARDMDVLRAALGDEQLSYLGASYGTFLGTTYAALFPDRVGRMVLDGAIEPDLSGLEMGLGQAEGFERATRAYVEDCVAGGECPLGSDVESAMARIPAFLDELDAAPLPVEGDAASVLTEGWGMYGIIVAMYDENAWPVLSQAFEQAFAGDGTMLMYLANLYASRGSDGSYEGNGMQSIYAVNCLDRPASAEEEDLDSAAVEQQFEEVSPTWGRYLAGEGACGVWPVQATETVEDYSAPGADPILVIGTTRDPATPYEWAEGLADTLDSGVLLTYDGDGHTAYGRSNECIDDAVDAYLLEGTVPADGTTC